MERPLLEGQQPGLLGIAPRALGEHPHALPLLLHLVGGALHRAARARRVRAVDKHRPGQRHEPAEDGDALQARLGGHGAVRGEDGAEDEDVELGLVRADEDGRARGAEVVVRVVDLDGDAGRVFHDELEGAPRGILGGVLEADGAEEERDRDAVDGAGDEGEIGCEESRGERGLRDLEGNRIEEDGEGGGEEEGVQDPGDYCIHARRRLYKGS